MSKKSSISAVDRPRKKEWINYLGITAGSLITALGLAIFLVPNKIAAGGVSGLATVIHHVFAWPVGLLIFLFNIPLFLAGLKVLGWNFGFKTLYGTIIVSIMTDVFMSFLSAPTANPLLAAIYGGLMSGAGIGIVFRSGGSTGGTDLAALLFRHFLHISAGMGLMIVDALVITLAALIFNVELALYAFLALFLTGRTIDVIQEGSGYAKAALIISDHFDIIAGRVLKQLGRGATAIIGRGLYTHEQRQLLLIVVHRSEVSRLKALVAEIDPYAFVIVTNIHEVLGEGFRRWEE